jgi:hypothetical protein
VKGVCYPRVSDYAGAVSDAFIQGKSNEITLYSSRNSQKMMTSPVNKAFRMDRKEEKVNG